jgi:hypothetical protein
MKKAIWGSQFRIRLCFVSVTFIVIAMILVACNGGKNEAAVPNANQQSKNDSAIARYNNEHKSVSTTNTAYTITKKTYTAKNIVINYPQILNMTDHAKQNKVNEIIASEALDILTGWSNLDDVWISMDYQIAYQNAKLISIIFQGATDPKGVAHGTNQFYTVNIDINKESIVNLRDIVNIDNNFIQKIKKGKLITIATKVTIQNLDESVGLTDDKLLREISTANDGTQHCLFYFTRDSLGLSTNILHAAGDHLEFEVNYKDITSNIKNENELWKEIL